jgi:hypothetical protein
LLLLSRVTGCAVKGGGPQRELNPPGNWFAPPGSNQSGCGGNETAEASGAEGRKGDLASVQAVTLVNAEQASKRLMQEPTRPGFGEGRSWWIRTSEQIPSDLPGYWRRHAGKVDHTQHGKSQR